VPQGIARTTSAVIVAAMISGKYLPSGVTVGDCSYGRNSACN
jgi:hypothetical protein